LTGSRSETYLDALSWERHTGNPGTGAVRADDQPSRLEPDFGPYYAVKKRFAELWMLRRDVLDENYNPSTGNVSREVPDPVAILNSELKSVLPGIEFKEVDNEKTGTESHVNRDTQIKLKFENKSGDTIIFDQLSSGERDIVALLFLLVEPQIQEEFIEAGINEKVSEDVVVLLDGPESYLHPDLQQKLLKRILNSTESVTPTTTQFIICTHSKIFIDGVPKKCLFYMLYASATENNQLHPADQINTDLLRSITGELALAALSSGRSLLWVEGKTDQEIFSILYPDLEDHFTFVPMGGSDNVQSIDSTFSKLIPELVSTGKEVFGIIDRDRNLGLSGSLSDRIHVLPATCVENLLLNSEAIFSYLTVEVGANKLSEKGYDSDSDIDNLIDDIVSDPEFIRKEVWKRFNEDFNTINIDRKEYYYQKNEGVVSDFDDYLSNKTAEKRRNTKSEKEIRKEVNKIISNNNYDKLDGK
jgi:hypothetical protein